MDSSFVNPDLVRITAPPLNGVLPTLLLSAPMTASSMSQPCDHPNCQQAATIIVLIERSHGSIIRRVCDIHSAQAQVIARQYDGIAYVPPQSGTAGWVA